jgi:hypothetical protein
MKLERLFIVGLIALSVSVTHSQQLKPTEIIYSRMPTNPNTTPTGANSPTIWVVGQDGSNDRFITAGTMPRISDDGRFLLFKRFSLPSFYNPFGIYPEFYVRELATGQETQIIPPSFDEPSAGHFFSPASNQGNYEIVYDCGEFLCKVNRDGTNRFRFPWLNVEYSFDNFPSVRRGGDQLIALSNHIVTPNVGGLYTVEISGVTRQKIPNTTCRDFNPSWSNDNQFIAFGTVYLNCSNNFPGLEAYPYWISNLVKIKPDGSGRLALTNFPSLPDCSQPAASCLAMGYAWTEDNSKVIAAGRIAGVAGLFAINADGSGALSQIPISVGNAPEFVGGIVPPRVEQRVVSVGGGVVSGSSYTLVSTIGEAIAGVTSDGGSYSLSSGFWATFVNSMRKAQFDFDGDGKTDIGIFRPSVAEWWIQRSSTGNTFAAQFGAPTDKIVPADYTGDGKTDIAFWRPSTGEWYVLRSEDSSFYSVPFGAAGDIPAPADYDNDGKADTAVFRPSSGLWFIQRSTAGTLIQQFGANGDQPIAADYDGDGRADIGIYRTNVGEWWISRSTAGTIAFGFGNSTDGIVPGDYTGDGKADVAFWRPSTGEWFILRSEDSSYYSAPFGSSGDLPTPGDYDGDGKFDIAVFRPASATWFVQRTSAGTLIQQFGTNGDQPVANAFVR